jgi:hypothetical protein
VMALGCQYHGCGSFQAGVGEAWKLFQTSFSCVPRVITSQESLPTLQVSLSLVNCFLPADYYPGSHCNGVSSSYS